MQYWEWEENNSNTQKEIHTVAREINNIQISAYLSLINEIILPEDQFHKKEISYESNVLNIGNDHYTCDESGLMFDQYIICNDVQTYKHTYSYPQLGIDIIPYYDNSLIKDTYDNPLLLEEKWNSPFLLSWNIIYEIKQLNDTRTPIYVEYIEYIPFEENQTKENIIAWIEKRNGQKLKLIIQDTDNSNSVSDDVTRYSYLVDWNDSEGYLEYKEYIFKEQKDYFYIEKIQPVWCGWWYCTMFEEHTFNLFEK